MRTPTISKAEALAAYDGNASELARELSAASPRKSISPQAIYQWPDGPIGDEWALKLAFVLKPDVFADHIERAAREAA
jgi:hypothetical protein